MLLPDTATRDSAGHLVVGGCDLVTLAAAHGTPLYVYDEATIRGRVRAYVGAMSTWAAGGAVLYSAKAYLGAAMVRLLVEEDCGIDVVSEGELRIALRYGMSAARIGFPGNNKTAAEVRAARDAGVGHLVVDSLHELALCAALPPGPRLPVLLRLSPGIRPDTHDFISTGQLDSKFGFPLGDRATTALHEALGIAGLDVQGVHCHIGSQIQDLRSYAAAITAVAGFLADQRATTGFTARVLSVGGGLGIAYTDDDDPPTVSEFMTAVADSVRSAFAGRGLPLPALHVEPGRSIVGPAGVAVYAVGARKDIPGVRTYIALDGGMADNIRPKLYGARYQPMAVAPRPDADLETVTLAGRYCESTDILAHDVRLPRLEAGDLVALPASGAYQLSMSSNYNAAVRPAVVFVSDGTATLVRRRETLDDLTAAEIDPGPGPR